MTSKKRFAKRSGSQYGPKNEASWRGLTLSFMCIDITVYTDHTVHPAGDYSPT